MKLILTDGNHQFSYSEQGTDINEYMFYTEQHDKKSTYQNSGVHVDSYYATS
jgi:hypothetical protein